MTNVDSNPGQAAMKQSLLTVALKCFAGIVGAFFFAGVTAGYLAKAAERAAIRPMDYIFVTVGAAIALFCAFFAVNAWRKRIVSTEPTAPSVRRSTSLTIASGIFGAGIGVILVVGQIQAGSGLKDNILSQVPITPSSAIIMIVLMLTVLPWITWKWHKSVDEHELEAYRDGALIGIYVYSALSICWWLGWRGGLITAPDGLAIFMVTYLAWGGIWLWKRFR